MVEWTVRELADRAGISPRALRHYHQIGLLVPDRIGANGYRHYGPTAVARLQRILLLRNAGLSLTDIKACWLTRLTMVSKSKLSKLT